MIIDIICLGYILNALLYILSVVVGLLVGVINLSKANPEYISRMQKAQNAMHKIKEKMTTENHRAEKMADLLALATPFGMILPFFRISRDAIMTGFDLVDMSYISMQRLKDRYKI